MSGNGGGSGNDSPSSPNSQQQKASYSSLALQYMYNAKAAFGSAFRKDLKSIVDQSSPIHCLGSSGTGEAWLEVCCRNIQYFSYRNRLPQTIGSGLDHDAGWGCMVRTGQMMLCSALQRTVRKLHAQSTGSPAGINNSRNLSTAAFHEGSNAREDALASLSSASSPADGGGAVGAAAAAGGALNVNAPGMRIPGGDLTGQMQHVVSMFRDVPSAEFSIYSIVGGGARYHIAPGEWFTATSLALCLQHLINSKQATVPLVAVHGKESTIELHELEAAVATGKPVLVMVSAMLGMNSISSGYFKAVHEALGFPASVGIVGGKPKKSMYFFASQKETLFMLDPHFVQPAFTSAATVGQASGAMDFVAMGDADSSMLLCFLIEPTAAAVDEFVTWTEQKLPTLSEYPIFAISRRKSRAAKKGVDATTAAAAGAAAVAGTATAAASNGSKAQQQQQQQQQQKQQAAATDDWVDLDDDDFMSPELPEDGASANPRFQRSFGDPVANAAAAAAAGGSGASSAPSGSPAAQANSNNNGKLANGGPSLSVTLDDDDDLLGGGPVKPVVIGAAPPPSSGNGASFQFDDL